MNVEKIISGGQTGVDRAALDVAMSLGIPCGGWCPAGRKATDGVIPDKYPLRETATGEYSVRTEWNVRDSDATLIINSGRLEGGTEVTARMAVTQGKPYLIVQLEAEDAANAIIVWLADVQPAILNIAGPRETKRPGIYSQTVKLIHAVFA